MRKLEKYEIIHYRPVQLEDIPEHRKLEWRKAEIMNHTLGKIHLRISEPLDVGTVIEIEEDNFDSFHYQIIESWGSHVKVWDI